MLFPHLSFSLLAFEDVHIVERVFFSSFIAIVSTQSPRNLFVFPINKDNETYKNGFSSDVLAVKFSRSVMITLLMIYQTIKRLFSFRDWWSVWKEVFHCLIFVV